MMKFLKAAIVITMFLSAVSPAGFSYAQEAPAPATNYKLLAPLPIESLDGAPSAQATAKTYIEGFFRLLIGVSGALAVVMIVIGGIQYMSTDSFEGKGQGKETIKNALWGFMLAIAAWLILNTVSSGLTTFNLDIERVEIQDTAGANGGAGTGEALGIGPKHLTLTQQQASGALENAQVKIAGAINLGGIRQGTVDEIIRLKADCNCDVVVTSATGGQHASGQCSHANGYKADLRRRDDGQALTTFITSTYTPAGKRSDGADLYRAPSGAIYALEASHWDIASC